MKLEERQVAVSDLLVGMYVCRLDRPWEGTPFPLQGVMVASQDDIARIAQFSTSVVIDIEMGRAPPDEAAKPARRQRQARSYQPEEIEAMRHQVAYRDTASFDDELPRARDAQRAMAEFAGRMLDDVRNGRPISQDDVRDAVEPMVRSILRNVDAFLWVESLRARGNYDYEHALNCSALAAAFGRHIGFPEDVLADMASGGLLLDVGKLHVRAELVARNGALDAAEWEEMRRHVEHGLEALEQAGALPSHVYGMIRSHHERDDGSGYPDHLDGSRIPLLARIAGVIDSYVAMTSERGHRRAIARHQALQVLYAERDRLYAAETVEQFMQCMSVYPTGSLVELTSGEVAVVTGQNPARRLRPRVVVVTDPDKTLLPAFRNVDLMVQADDAAQERVLVAKTLDPGAYGLDPTELFL